MLYKEWLVEILWKIRNVTSWNFDFKESQCAELLLNNGNDIKQNFDIASSRHV